MSAPCPRHPVRQECVYSHSCVTVGKQMRPVNLNVLYSKLCRFAVYRALLESGGCSSICGARYPPDQDEYCASRHTAAEGQGR